MGDLEQCKTSCEDAEGCQSITYFKTKWCSHYSTSCTNTKKNNKAVDVLRLSATSDATTTAKTTLGQLGVPHSWQSVGAKLQCDTSAGEVYMQSSLGNVPDLEQCKTSCKDTEGCQSITYFKSNWCSHYSTSCSNTKKARNGAEVWRLSAAASDATTTAKTTLGQFGVPQLWQSVGAKLQCDTSAGEVYMQSSPGKVLDHEQCKTSCKDTDGCQSITYFKSKWCSHYS